MAHRLGKAEVQYNDYRGTVAADQADDERLYELAGIDPDEWVIYGVEVYTAYGDAVASVLAAKSKLAGSHEEWRALADRNGGAIPVTRFELDDNRSAEVLGTFKRLDIRAIYNPGRGEVPYDLEIVETRE